MTGTGGLSFDLGSSAEGPPEQAPRKRKPSKKNLANRRGLVNSEENSLLFKSFGSPVTRVNPCKPYAESIILAEA
jgi:hypothetical protein